VIGFYPYSNFKITDYALENYYFSDNVKNIEYKILLNPNKKMYFFLVHAKDQVDYKKYKTQENLCFIIDDNAIKEISFCKKECSQFKMLPLAPFKKTSKFYFTNHKQRIVSSKFLTQLGNLLSLLKVDKNNNALKLTLPLFENFFQ